MRACIRRLTREIAMPVFFGGMAVEGSPVLNEVSGMRTDNIRGLRIYPGRGLGGRVLTESRPRSVRNYRNDGSITHDYDRAVAGEGLTSILSMPVTAFGKTRGLVYIGSRAASSRIGERLAQAASSAVRELQAEIRIRDEVARRVAHLQHEEPTGAAELDGMRQMRAELREIAAGLDDAELADRLRAVGDDVISPAGDPVLTAREVDVLSLAALGCGNAEIATRLCIGIETVRSYLRNAMRKLDVHSRMEAVVAARRAGELL